MMGNQGYSHLNQRWIVKDEGESLILYFACLILVSIFTLLIHLGGAASSKHTLLDYIVYKALVAGPALSFQDDYLPRDGILTSYVAEVSQN